MAQRKDGDSMKGWKTIREDIYLGQCLTVSKRGDWYRFAIGAFVDKPLAVVTYHDWQLPANSIGSDEWLEALVEDLLGRARQEGLCTA